MPMMTKHEIRSWVFFSGVSALLGLTFLASQFPHVKGMILVSCMWDLISLAGGLLLAVRPVECLRFIGYQGRQPSLAVQRGFRCFGVFFLLVGTVMAINLAVNWSGYWNGLY